MSSRFRNDRDRTPLYEQAVAALAALAEDEGLEAAEQAAAEVISVLREAAFPKRPRWQSASKSGLVRKSGQCSLRKLKRRATRGSRQRSVPASRPSHPPAADHPSLWYADGEGYCYVSQPYPSQVRVQEIAEFCSEWNLDVTQDAELSWWYPGKTVALVYRDRKVVKRERRDRPAA